MTDPINLTSTNIGETYKNHLNFTILVLYAAKLSFIYTIAVFYNCDKASEPTDPSGSSFNQIKNLN